MISLVTSGYRPVFQRPNEALRQPNQSKDCLQEVGGAEAPISMVFFVCFFVFMGDGQKIPNEKKRFNTKQYTPTKYNK